MSEWIPSDELVEKCETAEKAAIVENWDDNVINVRRLDTAAVRAALIAAVDNGELVPKSWLRPVGYVDVAAMKFRHFVNESGDFIEVYRIIVPAQPNDGGE